MGEIIADKLSKAGFLRARVRVERLKWWTFARGTSLSSTSMNYPLTPNRSPRSAARCRSRSRDRGCARHRTRGHCALSAMLTVLQLSKSFETRALFDDALLPVNRGDR